MYGKNHKEIDPEKRNKYRNIKSKIELINWVQLLGQKKNEKLHKHFMNNILYIIEI